MPRKEDSPATARRTVRLAVRRARERADLTQSQVAEAMEWSLSKVMRIENGEVTIAPNDLRPLLGHLGIKDRATVDDLLKLAKLAKARQQQWWDAPDLRDGWTPALRQVAQLETDASVLRYFLPLLIPGRLQIPEYAAAILNTYRDELPAEVLNARKLIRERRRQSLLSRPGTRNVYTVLDESVLHRQIGGPGVLFRQLSDLLRLVQEGRVTIRVIPLSGTMPISSMGHYEIIYLHEEDENDAILYRESDYIDEIVDDPDKIRRHRLSFERVWLASYDERESNRLIEKRVAELAPEASESDVSQ
jgi:transcriptional regulator with XRE-family HTH domain